MNPFTTSVAFEHCFDAETGIITVWNSAHAWLVPFFYPNKLVFYINDERVIIDRSLEANQARWRTLVASGLILRQLIVVFDLEWSQQIHELRFKQGVIVDRHFEALEYPLVISTGLVQTMAPLSLFLLNLGYTTETQMSQGTSFTTMVDELEDAFVTVQKLLFTSYNGRNSDIHVLRNCGIELPIFMDACIALTPKTQMSQADLYRHLFQEDPPVQHHAATDARALLNIARARGGAPFLWDLYTVFEKFRVLP